jgi:hypothetical protein
MYIRMENAVCLVRGPQIRYGYRRKRVPVERKERFGEIQGTRGEREGAARTELHFLHDDGDFETPPRAVADVLDDLAGQVSGTQRNARNADTRQTPELIVEQRTTAHGRKHLGAITDNRPKTRTETAAEEG